MEKTVIFGASGGGIKVAQTLKSFGIDFYCFLDNDRKKWGTVVPELEKKILSPDILSEDAYQIIIASEHQAEIEEQLKEMGQMSRLMLKEDLIIPEVEKMIETAQGECEKYNDTLSSDSGNNKRIIVDLAEGVQLGGIESWTYTVVRELKKLGVWVEVFAKNTGMEPPEDIADRFVYFDIAYTAFKENVAALAEELIKRAPCAVIVNRHTQILYAAYLAKKINRSADITIHSVIHNDLIALYRRQRRIDFITDSVLPVSKRIEGNLVKDFGISPKKIHYKESPVYQENREWCVEREYTLNRKEPIKIAYAGRLTKFQKRVDLFTVLLDELEKKGCHYCFSVAGEGVYRSRIEEYITKNHLEQKVVLMGYVPHAKMLEFYRKQDIFLSVSEFEGCSISMIEALSEGMVPVCTSVSGTDEFIQNDWNGFVTSIGNMKEMAQYIKKLEENRELLKVFGNRSKKLIQEKCNPRDYAVYIRKCCLGN